VGDSELEQHPMPTQSPPPAWPVAAARDGEHPHRARARSSSQVLGSVAMLGRAGRATAHPAVRLGRAAVVPRCRL